MGKRLFSRATLGLLLLAALYLAAVNTALNLPATRAFLNGLHPERFQVTWQHAWSLYPLRLELTGVAADGQTPTEQWQIDARRAAVSVSLPALLRGEIRVQHLDLVDIDLRLRPRPRPDTNQGDMVAFYPVIRNRDPNAPAEPLPEEAGSAMVLEIDDIDIQGEHAFWVSHIRGNLPGAIHGGFRIETNTGRLALSGGAVDLALTSLTIGPKAPVIDAGSFAGEIEIPPFTLSEPKGLQFMRLPRLDARVDVPVQSLDFLSLLMPPLGDKHLTGQGRLRGRLVLSAGEALRGTDLVIETHALAMRLGRYHFSGDGSVEFLVDPADEAQADLIVRFDRVRAELAPNNPDSPDGRQALFSGSGLTAQLHAAEVDPTTTSNAERFEELASEVTLKLVLTIPSMKVPDLAVYTRLFPAQWDLALLGGTGTLSGGIEVTGEQLSLNLDLASDDADLRYRNDHASADLRLQLRARVDQAAGPTLHLDGTVLHIEDAELAVGDTAKANRHQHRAEPWQADLRIANGALRLPSATHGAASAGSVRAVAQTLQQQGFGALLAGAHGRLSAALTLSDLDWIAELLGRPLDLSLRGSGELDTEIVLTHGQPDKGTTVTVPRQALSLALLRHEVDGQGTGRLRLEQGGKHPRFHLAVALDEARMRRRDAPASSIDGVRLDAEILVTDPLVRGKDSADLTLKLHSARVHDMSVYNAYLPANAPLSLVSGEARLVGDLHLKPHSASGQMLLEAKDLRVALSEEELSGDLRVDVLIRDGSAQDMRFDITGSAITLDHFRVTGKTASAAAPWQARLQLEKTQVLWHQPMHLDMQAAVLVKDARPFVAMLDNARGEHGWIDNLLTVEDLDGHLRLAVDVDGAVIEDAMISSPEIGIHAKGRFAASAREAMLLARWHNLTGALELHNGQTHFDMSNAPARFAAYTPGKTALPSLHQRQKDAAAATDTAPQSVSRHVPNPAPAAAYRKQPASGHGSPAARHAPAAPAKPFLDDSL